MHVSEIKFLTEVYPTLWHCGLHGEPYVLIGLLLPCLWEITISIAEFPARTWSLRHLKGEFVSWRCGYKNQDFIRAERPPGNALSRKEKLIRSLNEPISQFLTRLAIWQKKKKVCEGKQLHQKFGCINIYLDFSVFTEMCIKMELLTCYTPNGRTV